MADPKLYKRYEVAKENNGETTLMIIHNSVYNVTAYLKEHPGGEEVLLEQGGKDATEAFEDVGHSLDARDLMDNYKVVRKTFEKLEPMVAWSKTVFPKISHQGLDSLTGANSCAGASLKDVLKSLFTKRSRRNLRAKLRLLFATTPE
uniref:Cytochrome b5 n=1 Tax=Timema tahoe TaxID=61484 RepID=A0A7R9IHY1_9NEOP|nr:unnamed protein product [Timema tahoe]